ncbi:S1C family serine protease [Bariatricus sp. SGI.154]|uniref:S1C family serine protease n=1 Tax=Bariatricus sp. SGI.154 TaxID=3420549 RepID=UPI003CFFF0D5
MEEHKDPKEGLEPRERTDQEYSFLQETIKNERGGKRKGFFRMAGLGLVFGVFASFSFSALRPTMDRVFQKDPQQITIPQEDEEEQGEEEAPSQETVQQTLDADSYRQMQQSLTLIATEANKAVVEVVGVQQDQDWTEGSGDSKNSVSGLIVADNGRELLILGKSSVVKDAQELQVIFVDGQSCEATLKKSDGNLGFAVYAVNRAEIGESTWSRIKTATLGSSSAVTKGDIAIVLGKPFGYAGAMGFGSIASGKNVYDSVDGQYRLINTDIAGVKSGSGFVVNMKGEIIALIDQSVADEESKELIAGYGITDVKDIIECLSNGHGVPYIGIHGVDVTEEIEQQGIPKGVYVKEVEPDSPAMAAGIQCGDIITSIGGTDVATYAAYHSVLMDERSGRKVVIKGQRQGADGYVDIEFGVTIGSKE